jgi:tellurite resistance protein TehA-like permease
VATRPAVTGLAVMLWAFGTWLVPMLVVFTSWRYAARHVRMHYTPPLWSIVFPLGMYSAASTELGRAAHLPLLSTIGHAFAWVAVAAWAVTSLLLVAAAVRWLRGGPDVVTAGSIPDPQLRAQVDRPGLA